MHKIINLPKMNVDLCERYLKKWDDNAEYCKQDEILEKLFKAYPKNTDLTEITAKVVMLNYFYKTNIRGIPLVAENILKNNIDERLSKGDTSLVDDIKTVVFADRKRQLISFASKYCSWHRPYDFPIYDRNVCNVLKYYRDHDRLIVFRTVELNSYNCFKDIISQFVKTYGLERYDYKQIDKVLWQLGKDYFI